jgi:hypothetical protein
MEKSQSDCVDRDFGCSTKFRPQVYKPHTSAIELEYVRNKDAGPGISQKSLVVPTSLDRHHVRSEQGLAKSPRHYAPTLLRSRR